LKPERWGTPLVQDEKYRGERFCDKRQQQHNNNNYYYYYYYNAALYSNRSVITDQTTYNNRPNTVTLDKTIKEAYCSNCSILQQLPSHSLHSTITQKLQKHKNLKVELARIIKRSIKYH